MKHFFLSIFSLYFVFLQVLSAQCAQNILLNPGFESGFSGAPAQVGWSITVPGVSLSTDASSGSKSALFCNTSVGIRLFQTINVLSNTDYKFEANVKGGNNSGQCLMFIKYLDAGWTPLLTEFFSIQEQLGYSKRSFSKKSPLGAIRAEVGFLNNSASCITIDETCFAPASNPTPCNIIATATDIVCDNGGTPSIALDDVFQCKIMVNKATTCNIGTQWISSTGSFGTYGVPSLSNTFLISSGNPTLQISDATSPSATTFLTIQAPATCSTSPGGGTCGQNMLTNPGFESLLAGWGGNVTTLTSDAAAGIRALKICQGQSLRQTVIATPGQNFSFQFKAKRMDTGAKVTSYIKYLTNGWLPIRTDYKDAAPNTSVYTDYTGSGIAPVGTAYIEVGFLNTNSGCLLLDELCLSSANACANDVQPPIFTFCPANISVQSQLPAVVATWAQPIATDACTPSVNVLGSHTSGATFAVGTTTVIYVARDAAQNSAFCSFVITVQHIANPCAPDVVKPVINSCPAGLNLNTNGASTTASWAVPVVTDNCPGTVTLTASHVPGQQFLVGTTNVTYIARDAAQNTASCSFAIRVTSTNTGGACGFLRTYPAASPFGFDIKAVEASNGQYQVRGLQGVTNGSSQVSTLITQTNGTQVHLSQANLLLPFGVQAFWGPDSTLLYGSAAGLNLVLLTNANQNNGIIWQKLIPFVQLAGQTVTSLQVAHILSMPDGILVSGTALAQSITIPSALNTSRFLIKVDLNGNKQWQSNLPWVFDEFGHYIREAIRAPDGSIYLKSILRQDYFSIEKLNPAGGLLWTASGGRLAYIGEPVLFAPASDNSGIFVTTQTNATVSKYNSAQGLLVFSRNIGSLFAQQNIQISCILATNDAGLLVSYQHTIPNSGIENALSKISETGMALWSRPFAAAYITQPVLQLANGGYLLAGNIGANRILIRTTPDGLVLPDCGSGGGGGTSQPDMELKIMASRTSVPQWNSVILTIRAKNNGLASLQNATVQLGQCSNTGYTFQSQNSLVYAATPNLPATKGIYNYFAQEWNIPQLAAGETADLQIELYTLASKNYTVMAWTTAQSPSDTDSQPSSPTFLSAGASCAVQQDDEALIRFGATLLLSSKPNTRINEPIELENWLIYPNPASRFVYIQSGVKEQTETQFTLLSPLGVVEKTWSQMLEPEQQIQMDLEHLQSGTYFLKMAPRGARAVVRKIIVTHDK
jgi:HYR domain/Secretion system C-terminal sorting domain/Domain of unknown function DUF11